MNANLLAHGVGRIYELPIPLEYYLTGAALAVIASFLVTGFLSRRSSERSPRMLAGERPAALLARVVRFAIWAGFLLALVTGATDNATGFGFAAIWLWVGLVVGLTALNVVLGGLWSLADPWLPLAGFWGADGARERGLDRFAGPVLVYALFWFELASGEGFTVSLITPVLVAYCFYAVWVRVNYVEWAQMDPFAILHRFASRASLLRVTEDGVFLRSPGAEPDDRKPMSPALYAALFLLLGATSLDNLRETHGWESLREAVGAGVPQMLYDTVALALLALPFLVTFKLAVLPARRHLEGSPQQTARTLAWSLAPIAVAYVLAHNVSLFLVTLPVWFVTLSDPLSLGWNLLGLGNVLPGFAPSPALVWFLEVALVVGGHIMAVVMGHRIAQGLSPTGRSPLAGQIPMTILMSLYTVGTLWLLSLAVVSG